MQTYARQGGTSTIFVNDDGLRLLPVEERDARIRFYANHGIGWVARPPHSSAPDGFKRAGRFKKASNMNYGLLLSLKLERHMAAMMAEAAAQGEELDQDDDEMDVDGDDSEEAFVVEATRHKRPAPANGGKQNKVRVAASTLI